MYGDINMHTSGNSGWSGLDQDDLPDLESVSDSEYDSNLSDDSGFFE